MAIEQDGARLASATLHLSYSFEGCEQGALLVMTNSDGYFLAEELPARGLALELTHRESGASWSSGSILLAPEAVTSLGRVELKQQRQSPGRCACRPL